MRTVSKKKKKERERERERETEMRSFHARCLSLKKRDERRRRCVFPDEKKVTHLAVVCVL